MTTDKSIAPFSEKTKVSLPLIAFLTLLTIVASAAIVWGGDHKSVSDHTTALTEHDIRIGKNAAEIVTQRNTLSQHAGQLADLARKSDATEAKLAIDHDILLEIRADVKALNRERNRNP